MRAVKHLRIRLELVSFCSNSWN